MAVSADEKTVSTRMNALLTSGSLSSEPSLGALSGTSSSASGASIGALPVFVIDAPSSVGAGDSPLGDLGDGGDDTKDHQPVDRKVKLHDSDTAETPQHPTLASIQNQHRIQHSELEVALVLAPVRAVVYRQDDAECQRMDGTDASSSVLETELGKICDWQWVLPHAPGARGTCLQLTAGAIARAVHCGQLQSRQHVSLLQPSQC